MRRKPIQPQTTSTNITNITLFKSTAKNSPNSDQNQAPTQSSRKFTPRSSDVNNNSIKKPRQHRGRGRNSSKTCSVLLQQKVPDQVPDSLSTQNTNSAQKLVANMQRPPSPTENQKSKNPKKFNKTKKL